MQPNQVRISSHIKVRRKAPKARTLLIGVVADPPPLPLLLLLPVDPEPDPVLVLLGSEDDDDDSEGGAGRLIFAVLADSWKEAEVWPERGGFTANTIGALQSLLA